MRNRAYSDHSYSRDPETGFIPPKSRSGKHALISSCRSRIWTTSDTVEAPFFCGDRGHGIFFVAGQSRAWVICWALDI